MSGAMLTTSCVEIRTKLWENYKARNTQLTSEATECARLVESIGNLSIRRVSCPYLHLHGTAVTL